MTACLTQDQLREALDGIARSGTDSAEHLRHLAARALHCGSQPKSIDDVDACVNAVTTDKRIASTVIRMLHDNAMYALPSIYLHGVEGKVALLWKCSEGVELLLVVSAGFFEMLKLSNGCLVVRREYVGYSGGPLGATISKYLPLV